MRQIHTHFPGNVLLVLLSPKRLPPCGTPWPLDKIRQEAQVETAFELCSFTTGTTITGDLEVTSATK